MKAIFDLQNRAQSVYTKPVITHSPTFQAGVRSFSAKDAESLCHACNFFQPRKSLTSEFWQELLKIECDTPIETYTKIKGTILKGLGFKHPELVQLELGKSVDTSNYEFVSGKIVLTKAENISKERKIASIRHEIEHMVQSLKIYKALGKDSFAEAMLEYRKNNFGITSETKDDIFKRMNFEFFETMSKDVSIINFDSAKYYKALSKYKVSDGTLEGDYNYYTNILEKDAYEITRKVLKALGQDSQVSPDFFPTNYKAMIKLLKNKGIHRNLYEDILNNLIILARAKEIETPENYKRFLQIICETRNGEKIAQEEENWAMSIIEKCYDDALLKKIGQKPYQQVEAWLTEDKFTTEDLMKALS